MSYSKEKMEKCDNNNISKTENNRISRCQNEPNSICKSHTTTKIDREMYRICPSKLSKRELEDLYFTVLENNVELKKTVNGQQDKIRLLSTQVQRMSTIQEKIVNKETKECCMGTKAIVNEQKDFISDLKEKNQLMADRIEHLNMRLCSAKQFMKTAPGNTTARSSKYPRHDCLSKGSDPVIKTSSSCQWEGTPRKNAQTQVNVPLSERRPSKTDQPCNENKCRTLMEDLKVKIVTLQEELFTVHDEYSTRISRLENEVAKVRKENIRVSGECSASEHELQNNVKRTSDALANCRQAESKCAQLSTQLSIEKRRVAELETQLRAANMSSKVNKAIEEHLSTIRETNGLSDDGLSKSCSCHSSKDKQAPPKILPPRLNAKNKDPQDSPAKPNLMKYSPSKSSSSMSQRVKISKSSSTSDDCNTCGCKHQLTNGPEFSATDKDVKSGSFSNILSTPNNDCNIDECDCSTKITSTPKKAANSKCLKCCFRDEHSASESLPSKNANSLSPVTARKTCDDSGYLDVDELSLLKQKKDLLAKILELQCQIHSTKVGADIIVETTENQKAMKGENDKASRSKTQSPENKAYNASLSPERARENDVCKSTDDSGYLDINELSLLKQKKDLLEKILDLQCQIHKTKIGDMKMSVECLCPSWVQYDQTKPSLSTSPVKRRLEPIENQKSMKNKNDESYKPAKEKDYTERRVEEIEQLMSITYESDRANNSAMLNTQSHEKQEIIPRKIQDTQILGNPKEAGTSTDFATDDTRAKTIEHADGTQQIVDERNESNIYNWRDIVNNARDLRITDSPTKLKIIEKNKLEFDNNINDEKFNASGIENVRPVFNPEKLKYLEADEVIPMSDPGADFGSIVESVSGKAEVSNKIPTTEALAANLPKTEALPANLPKTEALAANTQTAAIQTPKTMKEKKGCEYCGACTFDEECEMKLRNKTNPVATNELALEIQKEQAKKHDQHNSLQIPGPIPTANNRNKDKKEKIGKHRKENLNKENLTVTPKVRNATDDPINSPELPLHNRAHSNSIDQKCSTHDLTGRNGLEPRSLGGTMLDEANQTVPEPPILTSKRNREETTQVDRVQMSTDVAQNTDQKLPEKSNQPPATVWQSRMEPIRERDEFVYPKCNDPYQDQSVCPYAHAGCCTDKPKNKGIQVQGGKEVKPRKDLRRAESAIQPGTYTIDSKPTGTSPDNTDLEMSNLSDLPMEKEKKDRCRPRPLSPGEDWTTTYTSSYSPPTTYSLSEGEMPATTCKRRVVHESDRDGHHTAASRLESPPAQQMEEALQVIADELKRCKSLLHSYRPAEHPPCECSLLPTPEVPPPIPPRAAPGTSVLGDSRAPTGVFTLHIGTVVLSDEGVLNTQDKNLTLKWKFYDQNVSMTRIHSGRAMLVNVSTEYNIQITEEFLRYLKHEEMPIFLELDHEEQYARSALPLKEVLLRPNMRVIMSLALLAPARLGPSLSVDAGVIDLWCSLRAEAKVLASFAQPSMAALPSLQQQSMRRQCRHDCKGVELMMVKSQPVATPAPICNGQKNKDVYQTPRPQCQDDCKGLDFVMVKSQVAIQAPSDTGLKNTGMEYACSKEVTEPEANLTDPVLTETPYDPSKYPQPRVRARTSYSCEPSIPDTKRTADQESQIIFNTVTPKVKSPGDIITHALDKYDRDSKYLAKIDDDLPSQSKSSFTSVRTVRSQLSKRGHRNTQTHHGRDRRTFMQRLKRAGEMINIGANNAESKRVTISSPRYSNIDEPERDIVPEPTDYNQNSQKLDITILWLALNEECDAMADPHIQRLYIAYTFLGRSGAELETPISLPKPKHYVDKCHFNYRKSFDLEETDFLQLGHMAQCRAGSRVVENENDCIVFSVISEPTEDPLGIENCEDIGYAYLYLGDLLAYSASGPAYTEVIPVRAVHRPGTVVGVLAVRVDGLDLVRRCLLLNPT